MNPHNLPFNINGELFFKTLDELLRFTTMFQQRGILPARRARFPYIGDKNNIVSRALIQNDLMKFVIMTSYYLNDVYIRLFFSNLYKTAGEYGDELHTHINGVDIHITPTLIHEMTDLPLNSTPHFCLYDEEEFFSTLGINSECTCESNQLPRPYKFLHDITSQVIRPRAPPHNVITLADSQVMYTILNRLPHNWCNAIITHMYMGTNIGAELPYANLVMKIMDRHGIDTRDGDATYNFALPIGNQSIDISDEDASIDTEDYDGDE